MSYYTISKMKCMGLFCSPACIWPVAAVDALCIVSMWTIVSMSTMHAQLESGVTPRRTKNEYLKADNCFAHVQCMFCCQALLNDLRACRIWTARPAYDITPVSTMMTAHPERNVKHIFRSGMILQAVAVPDNACSTGQRHSPPWEFEAFMLPSALLCYTSLSLHVQAHSSASVDQQGAEGEHKAIDLHCNMSGTLRTCSRNNTAGAL